MAGRGAIQFHLCTCRSTSHCLYHYWAVLECLLSVVYSIDGRYDRGIDTVERLHQKDQAILERLGLMWLL